MLFLACSDHLASGSQHLAAANDSIRFTISELVKNTAFTHREAAPMLITRYYKLIFDLPIRNAPTSTNGKPLKTLFQEATSVSLENYFSLGFALLAKFLPASLLRFNPYNSLDPNENFVLLWDEFFKETLITPEEKQLLKNMFVKTPEEARKAFENIEQEYSSKNQPLSFEYSLLPFMKHPLLDLSPQGCLLTYFPFLAEKFTEGIYWLIFDSLNQKDKGDFINYWGHLCQKYIEEIFTREIIPHSQIKRNFTFLDPPYNKNGSAANGTDIMIFDHKTNELFLFEITFSAMRLETAFQHDNLSSLSEGIKKIVGKASQLDTVINDIKNGTLQLANINPDRIITYRPFVITMSPYPIWNFIWKSYPNVWKGIDEQLKEKELLQESKIAGLRLINVREMEHLGALQQNKIDLLSILRTWPSDKRWGLESLGNFLYANYQHRATISAMEKALKKVRDLCRLTLFGNNR
jgi:hypothetical protein